MRKKYMILMFAITFLTMNIFIMNVSAESVNDVQNERSKVKENLSDKKSEISGIMDEIESLQEAMGQTEEKIQKFELEIEENEAKIDEYNSDFQQYTSEISQLNETIEARNELLKNRLASYQENGGEVSFLEVVFGATSFNDFISRINSIQTITKADKDLIEQQEKDREKVIDLQNDIQDKIKEQETLLAEVEESQNSLKDEKASLKASEKDLKGKQSTLQTEMSQLENKDKELAQREKGIQEKIKQEEAKKAKKESQTASSQTKKTSKQSANNDKPKNNNDKPKDDKESNGKLSVGDVLTMEATAYGPDCTGCSGYTATGMKVKPYNGQKVIAVDPSVIPLGAMVKVEGYGTAIAADTGGAIKGNIIDVLVKSEKYAASNWGRRNVKVEIISLP